MTGSRMPLACWAMIAAIAFLVTPGSAKESDLNPAAISYKLPNQIKWTDEQNGAKLAVVRGDPAKPGPYIVLYKWPPHRMSRPHFHPNDRFITVLSGTWWVGTGAKNAP